MLMHAAKGGNTALPGHVRGFARATIFHQCEYIPMRKSFLLACVLLVASVAPAGAFMGFFSGIQEVGAENGRVTLDTTDLAAGQARHYRYKEGGSVIRFFVVRDTQGVVRAALDACEVCWRENKGYKLQGRTMLCINCGQSFALNRIGEVSGGCNPHPIAFTLDGQALTVTTAELMTGTKYIPGNRP